MIDLNMHLCSVGATFAIGDVKSQNWAEKKEEYFTLKIEAKPPSPATSNDLVIFMSPEQFLDLQATVNHALRGYTRHLLNPEIVDALEAEADEEDVDASRNNTTGSSS